MLSDNSSVVGVEGSSDSNGDNEIGSGNYYSESANSVLDLLSDSYSKLNVFLCKS